LTDRNAVVFFGAETDAGPLGAALLTAGPSVVDLALMVPDDLVESEPELVAEMTAWGREHPVLTSLGPRAWKLLTLSGFFDPTATVASGRFAFAPNAYTGRCFVVGADLGGFFGMVSPHVGAAIGSTRSKRWRGGWRLYLPGWGAKRSNGKWYRASPHRPELMVKARRVGWQVGFGPCGIDENGRPQGKATPGEFVDVMTLAYAIDADRGASFGEHRANLDLAPVELPLTVTMGADGAASVVNAVLAVHELALALDQKASGWFTAPKDRREHRGRVDIARTSSPGAIAAEIPSRFSIVAPLQKFDLTDDEHRLWAETFHGGRCSPDWRLFGWPFPAAACDLTSAFPMVAHHLGWWDVLTAERLQRKRKGVAVGLRALCRRAIADPTVVLDPTVWHRFGCTLVEVLPEGEPFPIELEDEHRPDGRLEVAATRSPRRSMFFAWPDVAAAAVLSGRVPRILSATTLVPIGRQPGLKRRLAILPGFLLHLDDDPAVRLVRRRLAAKATGDLLLAAELRVVVNSLVFGILARFDEVAWRKNGPSVAGERPGPWNFLPLASAVTAGARLLLAVFERLVNDQGGHVAYCDTDCWLVLASPDGGTFELPDGSPGRLVAWAELDEVVACFAPLAAFGDRVPVWKVERGSRRRPLLSVVFGPKNHHEFTLGSGAPEIVPTLEDSAAEYMTSIVDRTEASLGGFYADPPAMRGRASDGGRLFSYAAAQREISYALARQRDPDRAVRAKAPWDD
jgi:hypothetical protein